MFINILIKILLYEDGDLIFKRKMEIPTTKNSSSNLNSGVRNCIKSLRDIDKPTGSSSYFKLKLDEKPKAAPTYHEFKSNFNF